ncbi:MAG: amidase [Halopseudomonas aestusnigri]|nr:amidase [Halopseudomonas aestusnigri]
MFEELTISKFHKKLSEGTISCSQLVDWYLKRIENFDKGKKGLNSIITINSKARSEALEKDKEFASTTSDIPPLFGVPILVKDQALTAGIRTTFGSIAFKDYVPDTDAEVVRKLREAGAIILGKTAMCDFAAGWFSSSSMTGHTSNAYNHLRDSGGSSAGSGAAVAANFCLVAVGEDTGGSIRIPASFNNCYGFRLTTGLISRSGFSPLVHFQDTPGPMARNVDDLTRLLNVMVGYDPNDSFTSINAARLAHTDYIKESLKEENKAWRIGILENAFGPNENTESAEVNRVTWAAIERMAEEGVEIKKGLVIENIDHWISKTSVYTKVSPSDISEFLKKLPNSPAHDFSEIYTKKLFHPENDLFDEISGAPEEPENDVEFLQRILNQDEFRREVLKVFQESNVDFIVCPTVRVLPPTHKELAESRYTCLTFPTNTVVASQAGLPAISIPAGFSRDGLPIGIDIIGRPLSEAYLLRFTRHVEKFLNARKKPSLTHKDV